MFPINPIISQKNKYKECISFKLAFLFLPHLFPLYFLIFTQEAYNHQDRREVLLGQLLVRTYNFILLGKLLNYYIQVDLGFLVKKEDQVNQGFSHYLTNISLNV